MVGVAGSASFFTTLDGYRKALYAVGALVVILVTLTSVFVAMRLTLPISRLVDALTRFGRGELGTDESVPVHSEDEIGFLASAFNDMHDSLQQRDEQMQLMLSGIAHEVRNPLAGMELFCSLLGDELEGDDRREHVDKISRELEYLGRVVNDFLNYARRRPLSPERFSARDLAAEVSDAVSAVALEHDVTLVLDVADGVELTGEREQLRGVLSNLAQNAVQACDSGGEVRLEVRSTGDLRTITVADTGRGIPEDQLKKIFEPFFTTRQKGTGLGLALVHKTVQEHGGRISVESVLNEGTRVIMELPFDERLEPLVVESAFGGGGDVEMIG